MLSVYHIFNYYVYNIIIVNIVYTYRYEVPIIYYNIEISDTASNII